MQNIHTLRFLSYAHISPPSHIHTVITSTIVDSVFFGDTQIIIPTRGTAHLQVTTHPLHFTISSLWARPGAVGAGGCTHDHACHSHMTIDLASLQSRDGARRVFAGPGSHSNHARSAVVCSASRMKGELHPAKIVRLEAY